jgi:hypothetical protein
VEDVALSACEEDMGQVAKKGRQNLFRRGFGTFPVEDIWIRA